MTVVGFQGEPGAFSEEAVFALLGDTETRGYRTFDDLIAAVDAGEISAGLLPCENTIYGSIARAYDLLADHPRVGIIDETTHPIEQMLVGTPESSLDGITRITSHEVALEQCRKFLARLPNLSTAIVDDTAGAVRAVVEAGDIHTAAIGSALAAQRYAGKILARSIQDSADNRTRFFLISTQHAAHRTLGRVVAAFELPHHPGSLRDALGHLADRGLNLRNLVARPSRRAAFEYAFYVEFDCPADLDAERIVTELGEEARVLGRY